MLKEHEDNTKSFRIILNIYDTLLLHHGVRWIEFNARWKNAGRVKKALADKVLAASYLKYTYFREFWSVSRNLNFRASFFLPFRVAV